MTKAEQESTRLDKHTGKKKAKKYTSLQLIDNLVHDGRGIPQGRISYGTAKDICETRREEYLLPMKRKPSLQAGRTSQRD